MKVVIDIPKDFEYDYITNKFKDFFSRVIADIDCNGMCGRYEREIAEMFLKAFDDSEEKISCNCQYNSNSRDNEPCCRCDSRKEKREVKIVTVSDLIKLQSRSRIGENMEDRCLFKAKRLDNGEWVTGSLITCEDGTCKIAISCLEGKANEPILVCAYDVYRDTICQCTGLKDKNGKLICENDIINNKCGGKAVVVWDKAEWRIKWIKDIMWRRDLYFWVNERQCEVIGNIFDNPELLESEG